MFCIIMPGCNFSYSHCSCLFNGLWKKNPLYSCSQTINRVLFDMNNCKTWMWDETYLEESVLERTFLPVYQVPLVFGLISHSVLVKKERKNNLKTLNHAWEYLIWWQFVAVRSMSCYCCRFAPLHIYIYMK